MVKYHIIQTKTAGAYLAGEDSYCKIARNSGVRSHSNLSQYVQIYFKYKLGTADSLPHIA